jgi:hypothetical protein
MITRFLTIVDSPQLNALLSDCLIEDFPVLFLNLFIVSYPSYNPTGTVSHSLYHTSALLTQLFFAFIDGKS